MTHAPPRSASELVVETARYRLELSPDGLLAIVTAPDGRHLVSLRPLAAFDTLAGLDETLAVEPPRVVAAEPRTFEIARRSTAWARAGVTLVCTDEAVEVHAWVEGEAVLTDVHLLAGRLLVPGRPLGFLPSGSSLRTLFSPNPGDPAKLTRPAGEPATIGAASDDEPGRGSWFFTPAPLCYALTTGEGDDWLGVSLAAPVDELTFTQLAYVPSDRAFALRLEYEGHTRVEGSFRAPVAVLAPGAADPYDALRRHRADLEARGLVPMRAVAEPAWWREPIFCGWGAQCHLAATAGGRAPDHATQAAYDGFLGELERHGLVPGTVVIDDKWQDAYGTNRPDETKWPDLKGWIAARHERGQRVLLWWKAWDFEGLPPELCVRTPEGAPVALDPTHPDARGVLREAIVSMLGPGGLDADGLKVDFTGKTPTGRSLVAHGRPWGIALLHELLRVVYEAAREAKPDALVITHTPHPGFVDVTDMIRLNDMLRLRDRGPVPDVVAQMVYRAEVARAACPELPIDTDDWCVPDRAAWRAFLERKPGLGVPALYYATHLDRTGEELREDDYEALRRVWARGREEGLS